MRVDRIALYNLIRELGEFRQPGDSMSTKYHHFTYKKLHFVACNNIHGRSVQIQIAKKDGVSVMEEYKVPFLPWNDAITIYEVGDKNRYADKDLTGEDTIDSYIDEAFNHMKAILYKREEDKRQAELKKLRIAEEEKKKLQQEVVSIIKNSESIL